MYLFLGAVPSAPFTTISLQEDKKVGEDDGKVLADLLVARLPRQTIKQLLARLLELEYYTGQLHGEDVAPLHAAVVALKGSDQCPVS